MSDQLLPCLECGEAFAYEQGALLLCPMCGHEWSAANVPGFGRMQLKSSVVKKVV